MPEPQTKQGLRNLNGHELNGRHNGKRKDRRLDGGVDYHDCFAFSRSVETKVDGVASVTRECGICRKPVRV